MFLYIPLYNLIVWRDDMRTDIREVIALKKINGEKINCSAIARQYDCDPRTVRKYYNERDENYTRKSRVIKKKTDGFEAIIEEKYLRYNAPAIAIFNLIKDEYGYTGSYSTIKAFTHKLKKDKQSEATIRFETSPGLQCQIDWKEELTLVSKYGEVIVINIFLAILGYSRYKYIELTLDRNQDTLFRCLRNTIGYYGGVPKQFLFDNMKTVADKSRTQYDKVVYNERFYQFSKDCGFEPKSCMAYRPETKGKVEVVAKIMNRLKVYNNEFKDLNDLINIVIKLNKDINSEVSQTTLEKPVDRFIKEKEYLSPEPRYDILEAYYDNQELSRKVPKDCLITYQKHKYSVPPTYVGKIVTLKAKEDNLYIYYNKTLISSHKLDEKTINYNFDDYRNLLQRLLSNKEDIERIAKENLTLFDKL